MGDWMGNMAYYQNLPFLSFRVSSDPSLPPSMLTWIGLKTTTSPSFDRSGKICVCLNSSVFS